MGTIYEQGAAEEKARSNKAQTAQYVATMKRRLANIETELKTLRQTDEVIETRLKGVNSSFDEAAERFVYRLWNDSANGRPVRIDLSDSDTLSFFLRESIAEKLPGLIHRFTSKSCDGSPRSNIEKTIAALDAEADGLRQQITEHGQ